LGYVRLSDGKCIIDKFQNDMNLKKQINAKMLSIKKKRNSYSGILKIQYGNKINSQDSTL
jgi:hypothetical protein